MLANLLRRIVSAPRAFSLAALGLLAALPALAVTAAPSGLVVSQVYGGGGNSGATLKNDFIEIFNGTTAAVPLSGYSVQYASSTGTAWQVTPLTSVTLQPGEYYLIQEAPGAGGTSNLPTPDATGSINLSSTSGKVAFSKSTTALTGACPSTDPNLVDLVSFGTAATACYGNPTATLTNTTAALRNNGGCTNTQNNTADFTTGTPNPHNTSATFNVCPTTGGPTNIGVSGLANPASINTGTATLLTATITPGSNPTSTGITVSVNLNAIGGSSTQKLYDDGSNGDVTPNDNVFSYSTTVNTAGTFSFPVTATDSQTRTGSGTIALTATTPPPTVAIHAINGTGTTSPYAGQSVTTSGIVTSVLSGGFYLQTPDNQVDADPNTSEAIYVYRGGTALPSYILVGNSVQVSGKVANYASTPSYTPDTEIDNPTFQLLTTGNALPAPVLIGTAQDSPSGGIAQFVKYKGMRVSIASLTTTEGTDANLTESTETNVSNGQFWGVVTGIPRPFREPGIAANDATYTTPIPSTVPIFDNNPELLFVDSLATGGPAIDLTANVVLTNVNGVLDFTNGYADILLDPTNRPTASPNMIPQPLPTPASNEFTIASFNMERFYTSDSTAAKNPGSSVVVVTPAAYQRRLTKASLAIRNYLNTPDIVGAQEIMDLEVLTDLANQISTDAKAANQPDPAYSPYLFLATDGTGINTGFLVKNTVTVNKVEQFGLTTTFTNATGAQATLNDRTPLVLHAGIKRAGGADFPITVIDVHQRSLNGVDDPSTTGQTVRIKREAQAEYLAQLIQGYQAAGEHVVTVGDFNSFQFNDGFADTIGVSKGNPVPANQDIIPPTANYIPPTPSLVDLVTTLPANQQQSYTFAGNAQVLDHVLITQDLLPYVDRFAQAHFDADYPLVLLNDATTPSRVSDHDPALAYFAIPPIPGTVTIITRASLAKVTGGYQATITLTNTGTGTAPAVTITGATLGTASGTPLPLAFGDVAPNGGTATATITFPSSAGPDGAASAERYSGTYTGGTFAASIRAVLP